MKIISRSCRVFPPVPTNGAEPIEDLINEELPPIGVPVGHGIYERIKGIQVPEHPLKRGLRGLSWLREKIKERLRERSARKFLGRKSY
jgi:hypothetical protein